LRYANLINPEITKAQLLGYSNGVFDKHRETGGKSDLILKFYQALVSPDVAESSIFHFRGCNSQLCQLAIDHVERHCSVVRNVSIPALAVVKGATRDPRTD
jgi:hypothetical protein